MLLFRAIFSVSTHLTNIRTLVLPSPSRNTSGLSSVSSRKCLVMGIQAREIKKGGPRTWPRLVRRGENFAPIFFWALRSFAASFFRGKGLVSHGIKG